MSFFRVLLALLISGGIAYGLYRVVDGQGVERAVEAVRTEIEEPKGAGSDTETAAVTEPTSLTETPSDTDEGESAETPGETEETETAAASTEAEQPAESIEMAAAAPEAETPDPTDEGESAEPSEDTQTAAVASEGDSASGSGWAAKVENATGAEPELDKPMEADTTDEGESAETETAALPAARIASATSGSVDALKIITGGMKYQEALATLTDAGWQPRIVPDREGEPSAAEAALIAAGYAEVEGCKGDERPICRFEFVDGDKRIAAVITAGTGTDPGVIDAFLMDIRAE